MSKYTAEQVEDYAQACALIHKGPVIAEMLHNYAALLRERESAKAGVTDALKVVLLEHRLSEWTDEDGNPLPLIDHLSSGDTIKSGAYEIDRIIDAVEEAVAPMLASTQQPIPMILHCPSCHYQHIDAPEPRFADNGADNTEWRNPPHRSHLCHNCGIIWRPADVPTTGVKKIHTQGKNDADMPVPMLASARVPDGWMDSIRYAIEVLESEAEIRDNDDAGNRTMKRHIRALKAMLAAAPKRGEG